MNLRIYPYFLKSAKTGLRRLANFASPAISLFGGEIQKFFFLPLAKFESTNLFPRGEVLVLAKFENFALVQLLEVNLYFSLFFR